MQPAPGVLLIAPPMMGDPNFWRTVVLLCEHSDEGSFGLILNRPLDLDLGDVLNGFAGDEMVSLGGPVQQDTLHFLHRHGDRVSDAVGLAEGIFWGGDFETIKALIQDNGVSPRDFRFFIGYAGWSAGQLVEEIEAGGWFLTAAASDLVFMEQPAGLWRDVLKRMGGEYALLANFPDDPRMN